VLKWFTEVAVDATLEGALRNRSEFSPKIH